MATNLIKNCGVMTSANTSTACSDKTKVGYPKRFIIGTLDAIPTVAGAVPTATEMQTYLDNGNGFVVDVTNGVWNEPRVEEISGADTYDGTTEVTQEFNSVTGNFKEVNSETLLMFQQNNLNQKKARLWVVDSNNQLHGDKEGFVIPFYVKNFQHEGYGNKAFVSMTFEWERKLDKFYNISNPDEAYNTISSPADIFVETVDSGYVAGQVQGYQGVTGWNKATQPTIYFSYDGSTTTVNAYPTAADRTADTNKLFHVDAGTSLSVIVDNSSGFGGSLTFVSNAIADGATWHVEKQ